MSDINFLPPWVETNLQPGFYDLESGTCLQQTARMYNKVNQLIRTINEFGDRIDDVEDYIYNLNLHDYVDQILKEYIDDGTFYETLDYNQATETLTLTFDMARA